MADTIMLTAQPRDTAFKAKALRRTGKVPGVLYGRQYDPRHLQFEHRTLERVIRRAGTSRFVALAIDGVDEENTILIRDVQRDPVSERVLHVNLYRILAGEEIRNQVPLTLVGRAPVEELGAMVSRVLEYVEVLCLPRDMPVGIVYDISNLEAVHDHVSVADLNIPENVTVLTSPDTAILQIAIPRGIEEEEEEEAAAEAELLEGEEVEGAEEGDEEATTEGA